MSALEITPSLHLLSDRQASAFGGPNRHGPTRLQCRTPHGSSFLRSASSSSSQTSGDDPGKVRPSGKMHNFSTPDVDAASKRNHLPEAHNANELMQRLKRYGVAGVLSYGLFNTAYYLTTFLVVWFYVAPAPARLGYAAAVQRFIKVMAMVWAGSQVTKLVRAGGALALAPLVDNGLTWFTIKFKFESKAKAFGTIAALCFGLALLVFLMLTILWA